MRLSEELANPYWKAVMAGLQGGYSITSSAVHLLMDPNCRSRVDCHRASQTSSRCQRNLSRRTGIRILHGHASLHLAEVCTLDGALVFREPYATQVPGWFELLRIHGGDRQRGTLPGGPVGSKPGGERRHSPWERTLLVRLLGEAMTSPTRFPGVGATNAIFRKTSTPRFPKHRFVRANFGPGSRWTIGSLKAPSRQYGPQFVYRCAIGQPQAIAWMREQFAR
jgi:hypothetical protein